MAARSESLLAACLCLGSLHVIACSRPDSGVMCHNSNCAEPQVSSRDDSVEGLEHSLALVDATGTALIDGTEMDLMFNDGRCLFAHDPEHTDNHVELVEGATIIANHLRTTPRATHNGTTFMVEVEIKSEGNATLDAKIDCALEAYAILRDAALESGYTLQFMLSSYNPTTLRAVQARLPPDLPTVHPKVLLGLGVPQPLLDDNHPLSELGDLKVDIVEVHPAWLTGPQLRALRSMNVEIDVWFLDATAETLEEATRISPAYILTGQARTVREWLDD